MVLQPIEFVFTAEVDGLRLDRALALSLRDVSRTELARWIEAGQVTINGRTTSKPGERVRKGGIAVVRPLPPPPSEAVPDPSVHIDVMYEDDAIVVVNKPPFMVVHPAKGHMSGTLVNGLLARGQVAPPDLWQNDPSPEDDAADNEDETSDEVAQLSSAHRSPPRALPESPNLASLRPGIVHRIDRGTSGVLVVAKTALARERLKEAFAKHDIDRVYDAICVGPLTEQVTFVTGYGRHPTDRRKFTSRIPLGKGKTAVTHVNVVERFAGSACRIECRLETGRTHQIRVHLAEHGAPLLGDPLYGKAPHDALLKALGTDLARQALHARVLGFVHPLTGQTVRFEAPWPADFMQVVTRLRAERALNSLPKPR